MTRYRIYSETLPYDVVVRAETLSLLRRHDLELVLAVQPGMEDAFVRTVCALRDAGVSVSVWPMIADADGRWANARNAVRFVEFVRRTLDALEADGARPTDVLFDLEPPIAEIEGRTGLRALGLVQLARPDRMRAFADAEATFADEVAALRARGIRSTAAIWPLVALDPPGGRAWQALLGTPVDALSADHVSAMVYTSILAGWSGGALGRDHAVELLARACVRVTARFGARGGISLGCVGTGALGDEPVYASPEELAEDAEIARAGGASVISLFDLGGVLARGPSERWLDALVGDWSAARLQRADGSLRVRAVRHVARAATWAATWAASRGASGRPR
jgi:hypothetical protein